MTVLSPERSAGRSGYAWLVRELVRKHFEGDHAATRKVTALVEMIARPVIARVVGWPQPDPALADVLSQDLWVDLLEKNLRELKRFRGSTECAFRAYVSKIAGRFARGRLRQRNPAADHEPLEIDPVQPDRSSPAENACADLEERMAEMPPADRKKMQILLEAERAAARGEPHPPNLPCRKTLDRWRAELRGKHCPAR